jgi:hypothetical protein
LVGRNPLKVSEIDSSDVFETIRGHFVMNPLFLKVMLGSNPEIIPKGAVNWDPRNVPLFETPDVGSPYRTLSIFSIFYAYQVKRNPKTMAPEWYYVSGLNPYGEGTSGWVQKENVFEWSNRVALYFSSDVAARDGMIFGTNAGAKAGDRATLLAKRNRTAIEPRDRNIARFPILDQQKLGGSSLYEIAMFGDASVDGEGQCRAGSDACIGGSKLVEELGVIGDAAKKVSNFDILFVLDNTKSMRDYIKATISGVKTAASQILKREEEKGQIRFAGAVYGDYRFPNEITIQKMDFNLPIFLPHGDLRSIEAMEQVPQYGDAIGDLPEAGLAALVRGISEARWSPDAGVKMVVWIGDHGSRKVGDKEVISVDDVKTALRRSNITFFVPINVYGDYNATYNPRFIEQAELISYFSSDEGGKFRVTKTYENGRASGEDTMIRVADAIRIAHEKGIEARNKLREVGAAQSEPMSPAASARPVASTRRPFETTVPIAELTQGDLVERILRTQGLSQQAVERYRKARQLMTYGYVKVDQDTKEFDYWVALEKESMRQLKSFMDNTCKLLDNQDMGPQLQKLLVRLTETFGGDEYAISNESVSDFLARQLFLPKDNFSSVLDKTPNELVAWWRQNSREDSGQQFRQIICRSAYLLNNVESDQRIDPEDLVTEDRFGINWRPRLAADIRPFKWEYRLVNDIAYYFVPVTYLPKDPDSKDIGLQPAKRR